MTELAGFVVMAVPRPLVERLRAAVDWGRPARAVNAVADALWENPGTMVLLAATWLAATWGLMAWAWFGGLEL